MQLANQKFSKIPAVIGGAVLLGAAAFIGWGIWQAMAPVAVPLQGMIDARTVSARTQLIGAQIAQRAAAFKFVVAWVRLHAASGVMPEFMQTLTRADLVPVK